MAQTRSRTHSTLFIPGTPKDLSAWKSSLSKQGLVLADGRLGGPDLAFSVSVDLVENEGDFGDAFSFRTVPERDIATIAKAPTALVLGLPVDLHSERAAIATLVRKISAAGGLAVRLEQSKLGWLIKQWVDFVDGADALALYRATVVVLTNEDGSRLQSCGMHAFSMPDASVALEDAGDDANRLLAALNVYQLEEDPLLLSGHTFAPDAETPKRVLARWPDAEYPSDHPCHNPFGVWRLEPRGTQGTAPPKLAAVFMPSLISLLLAMEQKSVTPLTRAHVERITADGVCMTMEQKDARAMERSRGYADLEPSLAWEQWQVWRASNGH